MVDEDATVALKERRRCLSGFYACSVNMSFNDGVKQRDICKNGHLSDSGVVLQLIHQFLRHPAPIPAWSSKETKRGKQGTMWQDNGNREEKPDDYSDVAEEEVHAEATGHVPAWWD